jgi:hypothetical protein
MSRFELDIGTFTTERAVDCASILEREGFQIFNRHVTQCWNIITLMRPK